MLCKNCGYENEDNNKFCVGCGKSLEISNDNENNNIVWQNESDRNIDFDEEIMRAYIGNDSVYDTTSLNIWAILFGIGYYAYRKMYLEAFIIFLIEILSVIFFPSFGKYIGLLAGFVFVPFYFKSVHRKVMRIKKENPLASLDELKAIAAKKGGTSILAAIGFAFLYVFIIFLLVFILL